MRIDKDKRVEGNTSSNPSDLGSMIKVKNKIAGISSVIPSTYTSTSTLKTHNYNQESSTNGKLGTLFN